MMAASAFLLASKTIKRTFGKYEREIEEASSMTTKSVDIEEIEEMIKQTINSRI